MRPGTTCPSQLNGVSMLIQRRRRWMNIETPLGECLVLAAPVHPESASVDPGGVPHPASDVIP